MQRILVILILLTAGIVACEKKVDPVDTYNVTVEFTSASAKSLTGDVTRNPKDSISLDFTITSVEEMAYVEIQKNGARIDTIRLTGAARTSYTGSRNYRADSATGEYTYRVIGRTAQNRYLGDGGKSIKVTINPDFNFWSARILMVPDSTAKTSQCYYSISEGKVYSYTEANTMSNKIDFGYYYDTVRVMAGSPATLQPRGHTIYALTNTVSPFQPYDISTWTKNATIFKPITATFTSITSAGAIRTATVATLNSGAVTRFSQTDRSATLISSFLTGQVLAFRTAAGKYGVMNTIFTNNNGPNRDSYILVDVKVEK